ncbi:hypothetical protein K502DRAFT_351532 [Neoconidiobolus thromboides FSU 785]|nr:hypothetical protein K502DRAFT_351532 [Neoconidiobolus thromboides FSU 785]
MNFNFKLTLAITLLKLKHPSISIQTYIEQLRDSIDQNKNYWKKEYLELKQKYEEIESKLMLIGLDEYNFKTLKEPLLKRIRMTVNFKHLIELDNNQKKINKEMNTNNLFELFNYLIYTQKILHYLKLNSNTLNNINELSNIKESIKNRLIVLFKSFVAPLTNNNLTIKDKYYLFTLWGHTLLIFKEFNCDVKVIESILQNKIEKLFEFNWIQLEENDNIISKDIRFQDLLKYFIISSDLFLSDDMKLWIEKKIYYFISFELKKYSNNSIIQKQQSKLITDIEELTLFNQNLKTCQILSYYLNILLLLNYQRKLALLKKNLLFKITTLFPSTLAAYFAWKLLKN